MLLTVNEVAKKVKVHPMTVYRWIKNGKLKALRIDGIIRIQENDYKQILKYINPSFEPSQKGGGNEVTGGISGKSNKNKKGELDCQR